MQYRLEEHSHGARDGGRHYFLFADTTPVVYVKVYENYDSHPVSLAEIETREGWRNQGLASRALSLVAALYNVEKIHHDGGYTSDGFQFLRHKLEHTGDAVEPEFGAQSFVADWDTLLRKYR